MNAMVLAAGRGTRLGELGKVVPKALVEVGGEPLLARQIHYLKQEGVQRIVVNACHLSGQIEQFLAAHPYASDIDLVVEPSPLGTAGGVRNALSLLGGGAFVVLYGDVIVAESLQALWATHRRMQAVATLAVYPTGEVDGKGVVQLEADGLVVGFQEKAASSVEEGDAHVNAGLYVVDQTLLTDLSEGAFADFGQDVFPAALARGERVAAHVLAEPVIDVGTLQMLEEARARFPAGGRT